jgi:hypothetical protein
VTDYADTHAGREPPAVALMASSDGFCFCGCAHVGALLGEESRLHVQTTYRKHYSSLPHSLSPLPVLSVACPEPCPELAEGFVEGAKGSPAQTFPCPTSPSPGFNPLHLFPNGSYPLDSHSPYWYNSPRTNVLKCGLVGQPQPEGERAHWVPARADAWR